MTQQGSVLLRQSELRWHGHWPHLLKAVTVRLESGHLVLDLSIMGSAILLPLVGLSDACVRPNVQSCHIMQEGGAR